VSSETSGVKIVVLYIQANLIELDLTFFCCAESQSHLVSPAGRCGMEMEQIGPRK